MSLSREEIAKVISEHWGHSIDEVIELLKTASQEKKNLKNGVAASSASSSDESLPKKTKKSAKAIEPEPEKKVEEKVPKTKKSAKAIEPEPEKKVAEPAPEPKKKVIRLTKEHKSNLAIACEVEEVSETLRKEFVQYVSDLTDGDFSSKKLDDHIIDFANLKKGPSAEKEQSIEILDLEELQKLKSLNETDTVGVFKHANQLVTGFPHDGDEDATEVEFEGSTYVVGDKTGRVYETIGEKDVFKGFVGVGKFKNMKV
jgi:hypothetical protein